MAQKHKKMSLTLHPLEGDDAGASAGGLSVASFIKTIDAFKRVAKQFGAEDLELLEISTNSPITLHMNAPKELESLQTGLQEFIQTGDMPHVWRKEQIVEMQKLFAPVGKSIGRVDLKMGKSAYKIDRKQKEKFKESSQKQWITTKYSFGEVKGILGEINIHKQNTFAIYAEIGRKKTICHFEDRQLPMVKKLLGKCVRAHGKQESRPQDRFPHKIDIDKIEEVKVKKSKYKITDLIGMAPNATGDMDAAEFVRKLRNEW